jgi:16S rRNA G966 N2-methylase RsmD
MNPFFRYFGSKWRSSIRYPSPDPIGIVCEPFAGSASYCVRYNIKHAVLVDLDERVCALWDYLIHVSASELLSLPLLQAGERISEIAASAEAKLLIACWTNTSPFHDQMPSAEYLSQGNPIGSFWDASVRERLARQVAQIRSWKVVQGDYSLSPESHTTFIDPPYQVWGKAYLCGSSGIDYTVLAEWSKARKGLTIVCEQEGATWLPWNEVVRTRRTPSCHKEGDVVYNEVLYWQDVPTTLPLPEQVKRTVSFASLQHKPR